MPTYFELFPPWGPGGMFLGPSPNHPMFQGLMSNRPGLGNASGATTASVTLESLAATMAKLKPLPRDVFVCRGTMEQFQAMLSEHGVKVVGDMIVDHSPDDAYRWPQADLFPIYCGLECYEIEGEVWVAGNYRDVEDARAGKLPVKRIG